MWFHACVKCVIDCMNVTCKCASVHVDEAKDTPIMLAEQNDTTLPYRVLSRCCVFKRPLQLDSKRCKPRCKSACMATRATCFAAEASAARAAPTLTPTLAPSGAEPRAWPPALPAS